LPRGGRQVLLLPVYMTVAHRMFPFFAGNINQPG